MWMVLMYLAAAVLPGTLPALSPAGDHVCLSEEKYTDYIHTKEMVPVVVYSVDWCWRIPPRCTTESTRLQPKIVTKEIQRTRIVPKCCSGYSEVPKEGVCAPVCPEPCQNGGWCSEPDKCSCESGYYGRSCEKNCESGTWGRNCLEKCDCINNATCEGIHGKCRCAPGWMGTRCEAPCDPGRFGEKCESRCDCDGEPCDHVTGGCLTPLVTTASEMLESEASPSSPYEFHPEATESGNEATENYTAVTTDDVEAAATGNTTDITNEESTTKIEETITEIDEVTLGSSETETPVEENEVEEVQEERFDSDSSWESEIYPMNNTDEENEIGDAEDMITGTVRRQKFDFSGLLQNLSIVCGVIVVLFVASMGFIIVRHCKRMNKFVFSTEKEDRMRDQDAPIHRFYGGTAIPVRTILDNPVYMSELDLGMEKPKMMTFKPLPEEKTNFLDGYPLSAHQLPKDPPPQIPPPDYD